MGWIAHWRERRAVREQKNLVQHFVDIYGPCPRCGDEVLDHGFFDLASARPHDPASLFESLGSAIDSGDWSAASEVQEFVATEDALVYLFVFCPKDNAVALLTLESFFELYYTDRVIERRSLSNEQSDTAKVHVGARWTSLQERSARPDV